MRRAKLTYLNGCAVVGIAALLLCGCESGAGSRASAPIEAGHGPMPLTGGATSVDPGDAEMPPDIEAIMAANAAALLEMDSLSIERRRSGESVDSVDEQPATEAPAEVAPRETVAAALVDEPEPVVAHEIERAPELTRAEQITKATRELAALLQEQADRSDSPVSSMAALSALEMIERGVAPDPASMPWLSERERELLSAFRDLFSEAGARLASDPNDLLSVRGVIEGLPGRLESWKRLSIPVATLCVRVDGFGQYEEFGSNTIVAGRAHRMIVYTELAEFRSEAARGPNGESGRRVRLKQDLSLYHDADGLLAWREADQKIDEFSRNERRDFFLVQLIELPRTLTVGKYRLKVTLVDEVAGSTAEAVIPIDVVADAGLAG